MGGWCLTQSAGLSLVWLAGASGCASDGTLAPPPGDVPVGLEQVASGLTFPLYLTAPPGDGARLFIVEKGGGIRIVKEGNLLPTPFLNLSDRVSTGGEQGLLGLAFDPQYASTGRFVVHYTDFSPNRRTPLEREIRISSSRQQIDDLWKELEAEAFTKGWTSSGSGGTPAAQTAVTPAAAPAAKKKASPKKSP